MIKRKGKGYSTGQTPGNIMGAGKMENNMG
jgi:hypothetical protein